MEIHQLLFPDIVTINKVAEDMNTLTLLFIAFYLRLMKHKFSKNIARNILIVEQHQRPRQLQAISPFLTLNWWLSLRPCRVNAALKDTRKTFPHPHRPP